MSICLECDKPFQPRHGGRPQKYCTRECFLKHYYRHPDDPKDRDRNRTCDVCGTLFVQAKRTQRYCSTGCYKKSWIHNNREEHNLRVRRRRRANPEWYREHEPQYYRTYRAKQLLQKPWRYILASRRRDAAVRDVDFELNDEWALARWTGQCEVTKIKFEVGYGGGPHPLSPSIDRIDNAKGYTQNNSRFVLWSINSMKGSGTDRDVLRIAKAIIKNMRRNP